MTYPTKKQLSDMTFDQYNDFLQSILPTIPDLSDLSKPLTIKLDKNNDIIHIIDNDKNIHYPTYP